jgi:DNA-binding LacI/PurR family transcriptional regulator
VAGFDDIQLASSTLIDLTSVAQDIAYLARESVRMVLRQAGGRRPKGRRGAQRIAEPSLQVRGSTAARPRETLASGAAPPPPRV